MLLVMDLEMFFDEQGMTLLEPARTIESAIASIETERPDLATLDMNLDGASSAPVAAALEKHGIPYVVISGYTERDDEASTRRDAPMVRKPFSPNELLRVITGLLQSTRSSA